MSRKVQVGRAPSHWSKPGGSAQRVSGELGILLSSVVCHHHELSKCIGSLRIEPHVTKILQNIWLMLVLNYRILSFVYI